MKNKNAIKVAYIIFLIICAMYHIISGICNLNFENWERIVCAATIASYFFSVASARRTILSVTEKINDSLQYSNKELMKIENEREQEPEKDNNAYNPKELNTFIKENENTIQKIDNEIKANYKSIFVLNVIGFVVFFSILTFEYAFNFFEKGQDFYTLLAFIVILAAETYQEHWVEKYSSLVENAKKFNYQEKKQNG